MAKKTQTSSFGVSKREAHDSSDFYARNLYQSAESDIVNNDAPQIQIDSWADRVYQLSSENMPIPDNSVALAFTSPPYNVGKDYDDNMTLESYLDLIKRVGGDVYRVLKPGGRYVVNVANLGRKPYIPLHSHFHQVHSQIGFLPMGEIIWQKGKGASGNCAWGSWRSAKAPRLRDLHEYLLVFAKQKFSRPDKGESDLSAEEFMESTLSIWQIQPESAKKVGHPAPFPVQLASRVIKLYSYVDDVVLDPFMGSGTTCVAAKKNARHYVGFDISPEYCKLAEERIAGTKPGETGDQENGSN
jgi:site-specific DNA-methyltransferase (adenine-specific)